MHRNLKAEMERWGVTNADIGRVIGKSKRTARDKLSEKFSFTYPKAKKFDLPISLELLWSIFYLVRQSASTKEARVGRRLHMPEREQTTIRLPCELIEQLRKEAENECQ